MISSSLTLILLLVGGQTAVFVPDPPGGPGREYVFPIGDDESGGGGGGANYRNCKIRSEFSYDPMYCVYSDPNNTRRRCFTYP
ncbi:MAG: hypothetical protein LBQ86_02040 [Holophagales bacterium]|jgi:hypothetical protein|nr:hypothetical protein [Holophagales bacterium]